MNICQMDGYFKLEDLMVVVVVVIVVVVVKRTILQLAPTGQNNTFLWVLRLTSREEGRRVK